MKNILIYAIAILASLNSYAENKNTIIFDENTSASKSIKFDLFFVDTNNSLTANEIVKLGEVYQNTDELKNRRGRHWSKLEINNTEDKNIILSLNKDTSKRDLELYILNAENELVKLDISNASGFNYAFEIIKADKTKAAPSRNVTFSISKHSAINLIIKHPLNFDPNSQDSFVVSKYIQKSEIDRGTLYIEGILFGGIFSIFIFSVFVAVINRDISNILFCSWLLFSLLSTVLSSQISDNGSRLGEFFLDINNLKSPITKDFAEDGSIYIEFLVAAMCLFQVYIGSILKIRENYPKLHMPYLILASTIYLQIFVVIAHSMFSILGSPGFDGINSFLYDKIHIADISSYAQFAWPFLVTILCLDMLHRGNLWIIFFLAAMVVSIANGPLLALIYPYMDPFWNLMGKTLGISTDLAHNIYFPFFTLIQAIILTCGVASRLKFSQIQLAKATEKN